MTPRYVFGGTATAVALVLAVMTYANLEPATDGPVSVPPRPGIDGPVAAGPDASADRRAEGEKPDAPSKLALLQGNERDSAAIGKASPAQPKTEAPAGAAAPQRRPAGEQSADEAKAFASKPLADAQKPGDVVVQGRLSPAPQELTASTGAAVPQRGAPQAAPTTMAERQNQPPESGRAKAKESFERRSGLSQGGSAGVASAIGKMARNIAPSPTSKNRGRALQRGDQVRSHYQDTGRDQFQSVTENEIKRVGDAPVSTFSVDVDTASYAFVRRMLNRGRLPQKNAVRVEELVNYFDYDYPLPAARERPFEPSVTVMESPWKTGNKLVHIGIRGYDIDTAEKPRSNLVFLLDVSGSMNAPDKLPLMVSSMKLLLNGLQPEDTVAIVVYAGASGTVLEPTKVAEKHKILAALDRLRAGGSTAGAAGIRQAYALAEGTFDKTAVNRVILATDGDFNVGITNREELKGYVERKRKTGVFLSVLGFGQGNLNDHLMQTLAQNGNGVAAHIDTLNEARKVLVEEASSTLFPIAKDVKIQVEFNPATVSEYRLVGYETRALKRQDFANDKVDAGDIGAGHTVTAIYEITPVKGGNPVVEGNRYQSAQPAAKASGTKFENEYAFLKIRYKLPASDTSSLTTVPITVAEADGGKARTDSARRLREARWATAVAGFGQILKGGKYTASLSYEDVIAMARAAKGEDNFGYRSEFINLVRLARSAAGSPRK
jgi:Ca-activated chloride channel family protein